MPSEKRTETIEQIGGRPFLVEWCALMGKRSKNYYNAMNDADLLAAYEALLMTESEIMKRGGDF